MFGMGMAEIVVILGLALIILGPEKLPGAARTAGKALREIRKTGDQLRDALMAEETPRVSAPAPASPAALAHVGPVDQWDHEIDPWDEPPPSVVASPVALGASAPRPGEVVALAPRAKSAPAAQDGRSEHIMWGAECLEPRAAHDQEDAA